MFYNLLNGTQIGTWERRTVWKLNDSLAWTINDCYIYGCVPIKFYTDFASVPRHFHMYDLFGGVCNSPATVHDYLYRTKAYIYVNPNLIKEIDDFPSDAKNWLSNITNKDWYGNFPKELADYIFKKLMIEDDESELVYNPMYSAVRAAGYSSFHKFNVFDELPCDRYYKLGDANSLCGLRPVREY